MQALCGLQGIFDLFNCKTPEYGREKQECQQKAEDSCGSYVK